LNGADYADGRTGNAKLGDMVALGNGKFIVIEQGAAPGGKVFNKLMLVEIAARPTSTPLHTTRLPPTWKRVRWARWRSMAPTGPKWSR
jgi:hypothetical protein